MSNWISVKQLPSQFLGYEKLATVPKIEYRPYTHGEVKLLSEKSVSDDDKYQITLDGIRTNFPKGKLYFDDYRYILVLRTLSTVDTQDFDVQFIDTDGSLKTQKFNLRDIEYEDVRVKKLPFRFRLSDGRHVSMTLPTLDHVNELELKGLAGDIVYKYVLPDEANDVKKYVDGMSSSDVVDLERLIQQYLVLEPVVHPTLSKVNPDDANEEQKEGRVVVTVDSITPFRESHRDLESRISFDA